MFFEIPSGILTARIGIKPLLLLGYAVTSLAYLLSHQEERLALYRIFSYNGVDYNIKIDGMDCLSRSVTRCYVGL